MAKTDYLGVTTEQDTVLIGNGKAFGSFGEIVQGRMSDDIDFLVTLPINMWSRCQLICKPHDGLVTIEGALSKSRTVAMQLLSHLGIEHGFHISATFERELPTGKGLSSSTADMLAMIHAIEDSFGIIVSKKHISRLFHAIEPHDALHYNTSVVYNHRKGILLQEFEYIPQFTILGIDFGGTISTQEYNHSINFQPSEIQQYEDLMKRLVEAFECHNDELIASCASESSRIHANRTNNTLLFDVLRVAFKNLNALGVVNTHSGTCVGLLYPSSISHEKLAERRSMLAKLFQKKIFITRTLSYI